MNAYVKQAVPVEIVAILDRSGSMSSIVDDAIGGFNTFLKAQQDAPGEATLSLVLFDDQYEQPVVNANIQDVLPLTHETFVPRGMTALHDAIGRTLTGLFARNPKRAIITILTDGLENASREYMAPRIKELLKQAEDKGWSVVYLAANQDAFAVGGALGVKATNTANFTFDSVGVTRAYASANASTLDYRAGGTGEVKP